MKNFQQLVLRNTPLDGPEALTLIAELQQEYVLRYGGPDETPVDPRQFDPPDGAFLIAEVDQEPVGCAGLRRHDESIVELKRMYVRAAHRRRGLARALLAAVEDRARQAGYRQVLLETGSQQPEAVALYLASGYRAVENVGYYKHSALARSFLKDLRSTP
jgi:GNAT superfamily N-acetyltransferase